MQRRKFLTHALKTTIAVSAMPSVFSCATPRKEESSDPMIADMISEIESLIPGLLKTHNVPSVAIAMLHAGKQVWSKGFGTSSVTSGKPVDGDTVFECASISKTVFAYAIMKLCEKGTLDLDKPLADYGVSLGLNDPRAAQITARQVLSHQSGLQDFRSSEDPLKFYFDPGKGFMYSGEGYFYLQSVVTHLLGKADPTNCSKYEADLEVCATDIGEYLEQNVLQPLGMSSSAYLTTESIKKNYALPHGVQGNLISKSPQGPTDLARYAAAGGLLTTVNDYSTFLTSLFEPIENHRHRLNRKSIEEMFTPQVKMPADVNIDGATSWALGWAVQERSGGNVVEHSGGQSGYRTLAMISPEQKSGFVMFTNSDNGGHIVYNQPLGTILNRLLPKV
jgi:CubicO group peptidase (beta-lactamase class C family)